jgi:hypothetical protein
MRWEVVPDEPENRFGPNGNPGPNARGVSGIPGNLGTPGYSGISGYLGWPPGVLMILGPPGVPPIRIDHVSPDALGVMRRAFADAEDRILLELLASQTHERQVRMEHEIARVMIPAGRRTGRSSLRSFYQAVWAAFKTIRGG